jgi:hypothetical protein
VPDSRTWIKLDDSFPDNPKIMKAGEDAAWLYVCGLCYCARFLTDGFIPKVAVPRLVARNAERKAKMLGEYLEHQRSKEQVENERRNGRERAARWRANHGRTHGVRNGVSSDGIREPESEVEVDTERDNYSTAASTGVSNADRPSAVAAAVLKRFTDEGRPLEDCVTVANRLEDRLRFGTQINDPVRWAEPIFDELAKARANTNGAPALAEIDGETFELIEGKWELVA